MNIKNFLLVALLFVGVQVCAQPMVGAVQSLESKFYQRLVKDQSFENLTNDLVHLSDDEAGRVIRFWLDQQAQANNDNLANRIMQVIAILESSQDQAYKDTLAIVNDEFENREQASQALE